MSKTMIQLKKTTTALLGVIVLGALVAIFWFTWDSFYKDTILQPFYRRGNWLIVAVYGVLLYAFTTMYGGYRVGYLRVSEIIYSQILSLGFINGITYLQISLIARHLLPPLPLLGMTGVQALFIVVWAILANKAYLKIYPAREMLLIYGTQKYLSLVHKMLSRPDKYRICEKISAEVGLPALQDAINRYEAVILCDVESPLRNQLLKYCYHVGKRAYLTPKISDVILSGAQRIHLFDTPLFLCRNTGLLLEQRFFKRCLDLVISSIGIVIASPFMLLTALAIKLYDGGPVFFKQDRLTIGGRVFRIIKFRSMVVNAEQDGVARLAAQNDSRITPVGRVIRKIRLDELPQLFNVFIGDMSIVGPRPERPEIARQYCETMPEFEFRLKVKAGLTGYAQVLGKYNTSPLDKLMLDLMYIERYSLFLDLKMILMTIKILFIPESTEGIEQGAVLPEDVTFIKKNRPKDNIKIS